MSFAFFCVIMISSPVLSVKIMHFRTSESGYVLRPEVIEGWFYLWRITKNSMYKEWIWDAVKAIEKYCKKEGGYAGIVNVYNINEVSSIF